MKKIIVGLLAGLVLGGGTAWLLRPHSEAAAPEPSAKAEPARDKPGPGLHLSKEQLANAGLALAVPESVTLTPEVKAYGRVLDPAPLVALAAEIATAKATLEASEKELRRVKSLHEQDQNASAQALEIAEMAAQRDRITLDSALARLATGWGPALAGHADLTELIHSFVTGEVSLARLDLLPSDRLAGVPGTARVGALADDSALREAEVLGPVPAIDPQTQGTGYLALLRRADSLPVGTALRAFLPAGGGGQTALMVPDTALVQHQGLVFLYVQTGEGTFERKLVEPGRTLPNGVVITRGLEGKDRVVTVGAQQLLSAELQAAGVTGN
jgi:hypothetical protein